MSAELVNQVRQFLAMATPLETFVDEYIDGWRTERDDDRLLQDEDSVSEFLSSAFCVVDLYNPSETRKEYEFDEPRLRLELRKLAEACGIEL
jgi:hypothetical protein